MPDKEEQKVETDQEQLSETKSVGEKILEQNGIELEPKKEEESEELDDNEIQITQEAMDEFKELGYSQEDLEMYDADELKEILESKTKKVETKKEEVKAEPKKEQLVITEELASKDKSGFLKNLIGQPLDKFIDAYNSNVEYINKLKTKPETKEEIINESELMEMPPKDQYNYILKIAKKAVKEELSPELEALKSENQQLKEQLAPVQQREAEQYLVSEIEKHPELPGVLKGQGKDIFADWMQNSGLSVDERLALSKVPSVLVGNIVSFASKKQAIKDQEKAELENKKKSKIKIAQETKKKLKEVEHQSVKGSKVYAANREQAIYMDKETDATARKILELNGLN
jgi:hypothetical protein